MLTWQVVTAIDSQHFRTPRLRLLLAVEAASLPALLRSGADGDLLDVDLLAANRVVHRRPGILGLLLGQSHRDASIPGAAFRSGVIGHGKLFAISLRF